MELIVEILIGGFIIGAIYALGAAGLTVIFGVSGILNLAHGTIAMLASLVTWYCAVELHFGVLAGALAGIAAAIMVTYLLYFLVIIPLRRSPQIDAEEHEVIEFVATLLVALLMLALMNWFFGSTPVSTPQMIKGAIKIGPQTVPLNNLLIGAIAWLVLGGLWLFMSFTQLGKAMLAASMSPRGLAIVGYDIGRVHAIVWGIYGLLAGIAGVLLGAFLGASINIAILLTATAFTIVILGGLGNVFGSLVAAYILGFLSTLTATLVSPAYSEIPGLILLVVVVMLRPQGLFGRR